MGRELFAMFRASIGAAEQGAATFALPTAIGGNDLHPVEPAIGDSLPGSDEDFLIRNPS
jgi:phosphogluconate dehydratase